MALLSPCFFHDLLNDLEGSSKMLVSFCQTTQHFHKSYFVGSVVLKEVVMKSTIFWDITLTTCFHTDVSPGLFDPEDGRNMFLQNIG
jgi:hypothetical protein